MTEKCRNPWKPTCQNTNIKLYIQPKDTPLPICTECWNKIAESNTEWP